MSEKEVHTWRQKRKHWDKDCKKAADLKVYACLDFDPGKVLFFDTNI